MSSLMLVLGGIRSGKSQFACQLADRLSKKVVVIATGIPSDEEMKARIQEHQQLRPKHWQTIEEPKEIVPTLEKTTAEVILIDCLNMLISNLLLDELSEDKILKKVSSLVEAIDKKKDGWVIIVSNEVGSCLVPTNKLARQFTDLLGKANQIIARYAQDVYLLVAGIAMKIKSKHSSGGK
ncbi:MAG: bifunctional adenosylcobinamide kinase/adenosylcobinamide-phosphate guanylyltransferase [bacterium]